MELLFPLLSSLSMMTIEKNNRLFYNFFSLGFVQVINSALQLLVIPYVIITIGASGYGVIAVAQVVMIYLSTFSEYGFSQTAARSVSVNREDATKISQIFFRVLFTRMILCVIAFLLLLVLMLIIPVFKNHILLYLMAFVFVVGQALLTNWFFQGMEKMWFIVLTTLIGRILFVILVFLFIKNKGDDFLFLFFMGIGNILAGVIGIVIAFRLYRFKFKSPRRAEIREELIEGWHFTLTNLAMNTCQYANIFILRFFTNDLIVGYFSIAERIFFTFKQSLVIFSQSVYPRVCLLIQNGKDKLANFFKRVYIPFLLCVITGGTLLFVFAPGVLIIFSGQDAVHSVFILRMLCIVLLIICLNIPFTLTLLAMNQKKEYFRIYTLGGILNILSNIILAYFFQTTGTIAAIFITEIFITVGVIYENSRAGLPWNIKKV
jgi:polysaccharide transporter, PST family